MMMNLNDARLKWNNSVVIHLHWKTKLKVHDGLWKTFLEALKITKFSSNGFFRGDKDENMCINTWL